MADSPRTIGIVWFLAATALLIGLVLAGPTALAAGGYRLVEQSKRGGDGLSYAEWDQQRKAQMTQATGYAPGHSWDCGPGSGQITTVHYQFNPSCPECVTQEHQYRGSYVAPAALPATGKISIPLSLNATISNWPADRPMGFIGALNFGLWGSNDRQEWHFIQQRSFALESVTSLTGSFDFDVPAQWKYLLIDTEHSNGSVAGLGMRYVYERGEIVATPPPAPPEPAPAAPPNPPKPKLERRIYLMGEVSGISLDVLPHITLVVTPSFGRGETISADAKGFFIWKSPLPAELSTLQLAVTVQLRATREGAVLFEVRDHTSAKVIQATSLIKIDLTAPEMEGREEISIAREFEFATIPFGYFSRDANGRADGFIPGAPKARLPGYSYVYRQLWAGYATAEKTFSEQPALKAAGTLYAFVDDRTKDAQSSFTGDPAQPSIGLTVGDSGFNDSTRYAVLHEFGHFFDWASNAKAHRCNYDALVKADHQHHIGYLNPSTGESFVEALASWFVGEVQRSGPYAQPEHSDDLAEIGSLLASPKAFEPFGTSEELAIAGTLHLLSKLMEGDNLWRILKPDQKNLWAYYQALATSAWGRENPVLLETLFSEAGLYRMPFGSGKFDAWEPYLDANKNHQYDDGERFADLMFGDDSLQKPVRDLEPGEVLVAGQSTDAPRAQTRYSTALPANSTLALTGTIPAALHVKVLTTGLPPRAYVVAVRGARAQIAVPPRASGRIEAHVPGGALIWSEDIGVLRQRLAQTRGSDTPLASIHIDASEHPAEPVLIVPVDGSAQASPVRALTEPFIDAQVPIPPEFADLDLAGANADDDQREGTPVTPVAAPAAPPALRGLLIGLLGVLAAGGAWILARRRRR
jgi:hypothetical protein